MKKTVALIFVALLVVLLLNLTGCSDSAKRAPYQPATVTPSEPVLKPESSTTPSEPVTKPEPTPQSASSVELPELKGSLAILSHAMTEEEGIFVVKGTAKNVGVSSLTYAEIVVHFKDAQGEVLVFPVCPDYGVEDEDWMDARITKLESGETWDFEVELVVSSFVLVMRPELVEGVNSYDIEVGIVR